MRLWTGVLVWLGVVSGLGECARILAFLPFPARSHQRVFQPLLASLATRGHHVTVVTPYPLADPPPNYNNIVIKDMMEVIRNKMGMTDDSAFLKNVKKFSKFFSITFRTMGLHMSEEVLKLPEVQRLINSDLQFDLVILESYFLSESYVALKHRFNALHIEILPTSNFLWANWLIGSPYDTSYISDANLPYTDTMTFCERFENTVLNMVTRGVWALYYMPKFQALADKYITYDNWQSRPSIMEMLSNVSIVLYNSDVALNYPVPIASNVKEVAGINLFEPKPLPPDIKEFMDGAKDGVIYFTLGSHIEVSSIMSDKKEDFIRAFSKLKQRVLWKWEKDFPNLPPNVKISKWFPQQDILAHKNIKLFLTHGGFLSLTEAVYNGVPLIGIAVLGDQHRNVKNMQHFGYGIPLHLDNITETSISWAINEMLNNPSYKTNVMKRRELLRDQRDTPLERAVYWVEYVLRHGGAPHLRPRVASLPWYQEALLDVYSLLALIVLTILSINFLIIRALFRRICKLCCRNNKTDKSKTKRKKEQ